MKLGKALFYKYNGEIFVGDMYVRHIDPLIKNRDPEFLATVLKFAPAEATPRRGAKHLSDQFIYRFNHDPQMGALYAVVQFGPQFVLQIMGARQDLSLQLDTSGGPIPGRYTCVLSPRAGKAFGSSTARLPRTQLPRPAGAERD